MIYIYLKVTPQFAKNSHPFTCLMMLSFDFITDFFYLRSTILSPFDLSDLSNFGFIPVFLRSSFSVFLFTLSHNVSFDSIDSSL